MDGTPMRLSMVRGRQKGRRRDAPFQRGPRRERSGPPSSGQQDASKAHVTCYNCGKKGHCANECRMPRVVRASMVLAGMPLMEPHPFSADDEIVTGVNIVSAVDAGLDLASMPMSQPVVPQMSQAASPACMPVQAMAVTRAADRQAGCEAMLREESAHDDRHASMAPRRSSGARTRMGPVVVVTQKRTPADRRIAWQGVSTRTNRMHALKSPARRTPQPRPDQPPAPQSSSSWTSTGYTVEVTSPSVVVKPQKVLSTTGGRDPFYSAGASVASRTRARRSTNLQLRESANESDLHPVSPMFLDVEAITYRVRPPICVRTKAMLDIGGSLSFMSTRLYDKLPKRIMKPVAFQAQLADDTEMPVNHSCQIVLKFLTGSHPLMTDLDYSGLCTPFATPD